MAVWFVSGLRWKEGQNARPALVPKPDPSLPWEEEGLGYSAPGGGIPTLFCNPACLLLVLSLEKWCQEWPPIRIWVIPQNNTVYAGMHH